MILRHYSTITSAAAALKRVPATKFVPEHLHPSPADISKVEEFLHRNKNIFLLTGAGLSTESEIPDYRSKGVGLYSRSTYKPMMIQEFLEKKTSRQRYWARNYIGWPKFSNAQPNISHITIKKWQDSQPDLIKCLVTQNVDRLHQKAGSLDAIELHGTTYIVSCLQCENTIDRHDFQVKLEELNPHFREEHNSEMSMSMRPDGDIDLNPGKAERFKVPNCTQCDGIMKPDVIFFGDNVPRSRVNRVYDYLSKSNALLVLGSSLEVMSSFRFILKAYEMKIPIANISIGSTRGDKMTTLKINCRIGEILPLIKYYDISK